MQYPVDSNRSSKTRKRAPNYSSAAVRLRMASLVAALGLVIVGMNEAAKPETWERLGFGSPANSQVNIPTESSGNSVPVSLDRIDDSDNQDSDDRSPSDAWRLLLLKLDNDELTCLGNLIKSVEDSGTLDTASRQLASSILAELKKWLDQSNKFTNPAKVADDINGLQEFLNLGNSNIDKTAINRLKRKLFERSLDYVEDRTAMNRTVERLAWNLAWETTPAKDINATSISYLQLSGQPTAYRGQTVRFDGQIRGLEKISLADDHQLGISAYFVYWIKPADSGHTPYCVYSSKLADGIDDPGSSFVTLMKNVTISGRFFKLRSYEASNQQVEICPLIIGHKISVVESQVVADSQRWHPPPWLLPLFLISMPVIAALMALGVYRSTETKRQEHNPVSVGQSLSGLSKQTDIKSDLEKLKDLQEPES